MVHLLTESIESPLRHLEVFTIVNVEKALSIFQGTTVSKRLLKSQFTMLKTIRQQNKGLLTNM